MDALLNVLDLAELIFENQKNMRCHKLQQIDYDNPILMCFKKQGRHDPPKAGVMAALFFETVLLFALNLMFFGVFCRSIRVFWSSRLATMNQPFLQ